MKKNKNNSEEIYQVSATNRQMINYKVYNMAANEKMLYFIMAFVLAAVVAYLFYGGIGKDKYDNPTTLTYALDISIMTIAGLVVGRLFIPIRKEQTLLSNEKKLSNAFGFIRILCENVELSEIA